MYKAIKNNKIIAISDTDSEFACLVKDSIKEDKKHTVDDYKLCENEYVLNTNQKAIEQQKEKNRLIRNNYLETYIDPKQLVLVWEGLSEEEKTNIVNYRQYLLNYPQQEGKWWEEEPLNYEQWKEQQNNNN